MVIARRGQLRQPVTPAIPDLFQIAVDPQVLQVVANTVEGIQPGQTVAIQIAGMPTPTTGTVREVKSGQVFIDIKNPPPAITRGMTVQVKIK
jgi:hypothetical protein